MSAAHPATSGAGDGAAAPRIGRRRACGGPAAPHAVGPPDTRDRDHIAALAACFDDLPPIVVLEPGRVVVDGLHRVMAARQLGRETIDGVAFTGTAEDAYVEAVRANVTHGKALTLEERRAAVRRILGTHPDWSDRRVARCAGWPATPSPRSGTGPGPGPPSRVRVGADGRARPVDPAAGRLRVAELLAGRPDLSLRRLAAEAGTSQATALDVRRRVASGAAPCRPACRSGARHRRPRLRRPGVRRGLTGSDDGRSFLDWFERHRIGEDALDGAALVPGADLRRGRRGQPPVEAVGPAGRRARAAVAAPWGMVGDVTEPGGGMVGDVIEDTRDVRPGARGGYAIRALEPGDIESLCALFELRGWGPFRDGHSFTPDDLRRGLDEWGAVEVMVAVAEGGVVGCIAVTHVGAAGQPRQQRLRRARRGPPRLCVDRPGRPPDDDRGRGRRQPRLRPGRRPRRSGQRPGRAPVPPHGLPADHRRAVRGRLRAVRDAHADDRALPGHRAAGVQHRAGELAGRRRDIVKLFPRRARRSGVDVLGWHGVEVLAYELRLPGDEHVVLLVDRETDRVAAVGGRRRRWPAGPRAAGRCRPART